MSNDVEKRIVAKMILDSTGYNSSIQGINAQMKNYQAQMKIASEGVKVFGKDSTNLKNIQTSLAGQIETQVKKIDVYKKAIDKTSDSLLENFNARTMLKTSINEANKKYEEAILIYGKESEETKEAKENVEKLTEEYKKKEKAVESNSKTIQRYETELNKANAELVKTQGELRKATEEYKKQTSIIYNTGESLEKLGSSAVAVRRQDVKNRWDINKSSNTTNNSIRCIKFKSQYRF